MAIGSAAMTRRIMQPVVRAAPVAAPAAASFAVPPLSNTTIPATIATPIMISKIVPICNPFK